MSRRTFPPVAAAVALAALTAPQLFAQPSNPWRAGPVQTAPPPRAKAAPAAAHFELFLDVPAPMPAAAAPAQAARPVMLNCTGGLCVSAAPAAGRLTGTWCRELPGTTVALAFAGDELKVTVTLNRGGAVATVTFTADYAVTKDGTVHGVVTGADVGGTGAAGDEGAELADLSAEMQGLVDQPFAFRCRPTDGGVMVSHVRVAAAEGADDIRELTAVVCGKYKAASGPVPAPKPTKAVQRVGGRCDLGVYPADVALPPAGAPSYSPPLLMTTPCPAPPYPAPRVLPAPGLPAPPPEVYDLMVSTFGQMLGGPPVVPYPPPGLHGYGPCPLPCTPVVNPAVNPSAYAAPQGVPCPGACPPAVNQLSYATSPALPPVAVPNPQWKPGMLPVGTWSREFGPMVYVLTVRDGHLTITMTMSEQAAGKTVTQGYTLTADCYPTRDGLVGLFTGLDLVCDGLDADIDGALESVVKLQQSLANKPFALTFRVCDDALMIGNLRLPAADRDTQGMMEPLAAMAGRYKLGTGPKPKAAPVTAVSGSMTLPSPRHLEHHPEYCPPVGFRTLPQELRVVTNPDHVAPAPRPVGAAPVMPMPEPLPVSAAGGYSLDPNVRMQQLLYESEDLKQIQQEWRRFWFNDHPSHLTPERIHGGIY